MQASEIQSVSQALALARRPGWARASDPTTSQEKPKAQVTLPRAGKPKVGSGWGRGSLGPRAATRPTPSSRGPSGAASRGHQESRSYPHHGHSTVRREPTWSWGSAAPRPPTCATPSALTGPSHGSTCRGVGSELPPGSGSRMEADRLALRGPALPLQGSLCPAPGAWVSGAGAPSRPSPAATCMASPRQQPPLSGPRPPSGAQHKRGHTPVVLSNGAASGLAPCHRMPPRVLVPGKVPGDGQAQPGDGHPGPRALTSIQDLLTSPLK